MLSPAAVFAQTARYKFGLVMPLTGSQAGYGKYQIPAAQWAVEAINKTGGINGKKRAAAKDPWAWYECDSVVERHRSHSAFQQIEPFPAKHGRVMKPFAFPASVAVPLERGVLAR